MLNYASRCKILSDLKHYTQHNIVFFTVRRVIKKKKLKRTVARNVCFYTTEAPSGRLRRWIYTFLGDLLWWTAWLSKLCREAKLRKLACGTGKQKYMTNFYIQGIKILQLDSGQTEIHLVWLRCFRLYTLLYSRA